MAHDLKFFALKDITPDTWVTIEGCFAAPDNVGKLTLQLGTTGCEGKVYYDNAELYKVE